MGCKLNYAETATIGKQFVQKGYTLVDITEPADVVVINTCSVTEHADRECRQIIRRALRTSPHGIIAVVGCYAQLNPSSLQSMPGVKIVLGIEEKFNLFHYIENVSDEQPVVVASSLDEITTIHVASSAGFGDRTRVFLKIQEGCDYHCSYCTVPLARGRNRSIPKEIVLQQVYEAVEQGYKEIVLTGVNVGEYSTESGERLVSLLKELVRIDGLQRIRISSIEPNLLSDELLELWFNEPKLCKHWHVPLQSGSNAILRLMVRRYNCEFYRTKIETIKHYYPNAGIGADVIVGFPGETDAHFKETYDFISELPVTYLHVFSYSARPHTPASTFDFQVEPRIRQERSEQLHLLGIEKKRKFLQSFPGKNVTVLVESEVAPGSYSGLTEEYVRVVFEANSNVKNSLVSVFIDNVQDDQCHGFLVQPIFQCQERVYP
ncbi:MAG: tRNA (N(6)-L-threonylcarbamoyladenosine(37)-C(2))-methylthiotransferase MtaB [Bacteroidetes bacterium]|nr:tRNA (N(6)-L-threonylcarbamoyladenosine(37)-C(2))-methylthiotransferase MtaB [Bacteroidota bacterium]